MGPREAKGGNKPCPICSRVINNSTDVARHMLLHKEDVEDLKLPCPYAGCKYRTLQKSNLTTHIRVHTGEKPFACGIGECNFITADPGSLTRHKRSQHQCQPASKTPGGKTTNKRRNNRAAPYKRERSADSSSASSSSSSSSTSASSSPPSSAPSPSSTTMVAFKVSIPTPQESFPEPAVFTPLEVHAQEPYLAGDSMLDIGPPPHGLTMEEWREWYHYTWTKEEQEAALAKVIAANSRPASTTIALPTLPLLLPPLPQVTIDLPSLPLPVPELLPDPPAPVDAAFYQPQYTPSNAPLTDDWVQENGAPYTPISHSLLAELFPGEFWDLINGKFVLRKYPRSPELLAAFPQLFGTPPPDALDEPYTDEMYTLPGMGEDLDQFLLALEHMDVKPVM